MIKPAPEPFTALQGFPMKAASIVGIILMLLGFASLAYCALPLRLLLRAAQQQNSNLMMPMLGGLALTGGIALLFFADTRCRR